MFTAATNSSIGFQANGLFWMEIELNPRCHVFDNTFALWKTERERERDVKCNGKHTHLTVGKTHKQIAFCNPRGTNDNQFSEVLMLLDVCMRPFITLYWVYFLLCNECLPSIIFPYSRLRFTTCDVVYEICTLKRTFCWLELLGEHE